MSSEFAVVTFQADVVDKGAEKVIMPPRDFSMVEVLNPTAHGFSDEDLKKSYDFFRSGGVSAGQTYVVLGSDGDAPYPRVKVAAVVGRADIFEVFQKYVKSVEGMFQLSEDEEGGGFSHIYEEYTRRLEREFQEVLTDPEEAKIYRGYFESSFSDELPSSLLDDSTAR